MSVESKVAFLPAGAMNLALALKAHENGHQVSLWFHSPESADYFSRKHKSKKLPGIKFPKGIQITTNMEEALDGTRLVSFGMPSINVLEVIQAAKPYIAQDTLILSATKGFQEIDRKYYTPSQVIEEQIPDSHNRLAVLSGPNFARQIAKGKITGTMVAAYCPETAQQVKRVFHNGEFQVDLNDDISPFDAEVMGAFKNVVGLIMGFAKTLPKYGENTGAFILQKGLSEAAVLCKALGGNPQAVMELCGVGDYALLMNSNTSRNVWAGSQFGSGKMSAEDLRNSGTTIEGMDTVRAVRSLSQEHRIFMPLTRFVYRVFYESLDPAYAVRRLLLRS